MRAAVRGGEVVLRHRRGALDVRRKADDTPVTLADEAAQAALEAVLVDAAPEIPVVSEEGHIAAAAVRRAWRRLWLVDPLDGTKEYIRGGDDFSVNIALWEAGVPWLGVIYAPVRDYLYYGAVGWGAYQLPGARRAALEAGAGSRLDRGVRPDREVPVVVASTSHFAANTERLVGRLRAAHGGLTIKRLSSAIKLGMIAAGRGGLLSTLRPHHGVGHRRRRRPAARRRRPHRAGAHRPSPALQQARSPQPPVPRRRPRLATTPRLDSRLTGPR